MTTPLVTFTSLVPVSCPKRACSVGKTKPASSNLRTTAAEAILAKEPPGDNLAVRCKELPCRLGRLGAEHLASGEVLTSFALGTLASCSKDISSKQASLLKAGGVPPRVLFHPPSPHTHKAQQPLSWPAPALILSALHPFCHPHQVNAQTNTANKEVSLLCPKQLRLEPNLHLEAHLLFLPLPPLHPQAGDGQLGQASGDPSKESLE